MGETRKERDDVMQRARYSQLARLTVAVEELNGLVSSLREVLLDSEAEAIETFGSRTLQRKLEQLQKDIKEREVAGMGVAI